MSAAQRIAAAAAVAVALLAGAPAGASPPDAPGALDALGAHLARSCALDVHPWCQLPGRVADSYIDRSQALAISRGDPAARDRLWGWGGPRETFRAWGSAAFDGRRFYFYGGGHHHYRGNDLKVYDLGTLGWSALYPPSYVTPEAHPAGQRRYIPEHGPRATHVYDGLTYDPGTNALYLWGNFNLNGWAFDLDAWAEHGDPWRAWSAFPLPQADNMIYLRFFRTTTTADGLILVHGGIAARGRGWMFVFDPATRRYRFAGSEGFRISALTTAAGSVYGMDDRGQALVRHDRHGRALERFAVPGGVSGNAAAEHPGRGLLVLWDGGQETLVRDLASGRWTQVWTDSDGPVPSPRKNGPWGDWHYVAEHDVFVGLAQDAAGELSMWAYRLPDPLPTEHPLKAKRIAAGYTCSDEIAGWSCPALGPQLAAGTVVKGVYRQCGTIDRPVDFNGAWLKDAVCGRKAALIARHGAVIENVRITDLTNGVNAACVRWEGGSVTLRGVTCRRTDMGLLGNGRRLVIEDSQFSDSNPRGGDHGHLVYACSRQPAGAELVIRRSQLSAPGSGGHVVKTGCALTRIADSVLAGGAQPYSRLVDAFNGGRLELSSTDLVTAGAGGNGDLIGYGAEMRARHSDNAVALRGGRLDCTQPRRWFKALHVWPGRAVPRPVIWEPAVSRGCPRP